MSNRRGVGTAIYTYGKELFRDVAQTLCRERAAVKFARSRGCIDASNEARDAAITLAVLIAAPQILIFSLWSKGKPSYFFSVSAMIDSLDFNSIPFVSITHPVRRM